MKKKFKQIFSFQLKSISFFPSFFLSSSKITFREVIQALKDHAFSVSDYPVILSFENHCCIAQQEAMAKILVEILGDLLCKDPVKGNDGSKALPSPNQLKRKIIVKGKALPPENVENNAGSEDSESDNDEDLDSLPGF